jgi:hypothetical protein
MTDRSTQVRSTALSLMVIASFAFICGCHKSTPAEKPIIEAKRSGAADSEQDAKGEKNDKKVAASDGEHEGLHLNPQEVSKLGVMTQELKAATHSPEAEGFGVVVAHEAISQALADLRTADAVARQSQAALARGQRLSGTPGAMPLEMIETAQRQALVDKAALDLARQRLSSTFGQQAPWHGKDDGPLLNALARGESKLVRVTFPMASLEEGTPAQVRLGRIGLAKTAKSFESHSVWSAPADASVPGRSFYTVFKGGSLGEGERLLAWTPVAGASEGVLVPEAAALIANGKYWCYIEEAAGTYVRTEFDPAVPVSGGYFVSQGLDAGDKVVIAAAGQLLARELNPATEAE